MQTLHTIKSELPTHLAMIMDGNGRWAQKRHFPRFSGHEAGVKTALRLVKFCKQRAIKILSLFAFSTENWKRPLEEINHLARLFEIAFEEQLDTLITLNIKLKVIGDIQRFEPSLQEKIEYAQTVTRSNTGLTLVIAASYGGQGDIVQAVRQISRHVMSGQVTPEEISIDYFKKHLQLGTLPSPDFCIRTGGERRISNFAMFNLAYTELYFTETLWPDFSESDLDTALNDYKSRQRRFGGLK